jgi:hypothetical protein
VVNTSHEKVNTSPEEVNASLEEFKTSHEKANASLEEFKTSSEEFNASLEEFNDSLEESNAFPEEVNASPVASYAYPDNQQFIHPINPSFCYQPFIIVLHQDASGLTVPLYLAFNRIILECYHDMIFYIPFYSTKENPNHLIGFSPRHGRVDMQLNNNGFIPTYSRVY